MDLGFYGGLGSSICFFLFILEGKRFAWGSVLLRSRSKKG